MSSSIFVTGARTESHADIGLSIIDIRLKKREQTTSAVTMRLKVAPQREMVRATADVINSQICKFFGVADNADKTLFGSIFFQEEVDRFFLCKKGDREICKVSLFGEWQDFCTVPKLADFPALTENCSELTVVTKYSDSQEKSQKLTYAQLAKVSDLPTVALYNSSGFQGYSEMNKDLKWSRSIEKITIMSKL